MKGEGNVDVSRDGRQPLRNIFVSFLRRFLPSVSFVFFTASKDFETPWGFLSQAACFRLLVACAASRATPAKQEAVGGQSWGSRRSTDG